MKRALKFPNSTIIAQKLVYKPNNSANNSVISKLLAAEQKNFCAYTDEHLGRADAGDIEHFDPTLKGTPKDGYDNWFAVKHKWNSEKGSKWAKFQPIIHPTAFDFEARVIYDTGDYLADPDDTEAQNLIALLMLDDLQLADQRKKYINRKRDEINGATQTPEEYFVKLAADDVCSIKYPRAIREEFGVDILIHIP